MTDQDKIAAVVCDLANIKSVTHDQDIYDAGLSSIQALQLLVELETVFEVTLPDETFVQARTVNALNDLIQGQRPS
jgi:acyl carrier protein